MKKIIYILLVSSLIISAVGLVPVSAQNEAMQEFFNRNNLSEVTPRFGTSILSYQ